MQPNDIIITMTVAGTQYLQYFPQLIGCPFFAETDVPTTFADAPIGVAFPPMSVPRESVQASVGSAMPVVAESD